MQTLTSATSGSDSSLSFDDFSLDAASEQLSNGDLTSGLDELFDDLCERREHNPDSWRHCADTCLNHPIRDLLYQDPFTHRAFAKPRGYAGDAVMMDYIYGLGDAGEAARTATPLGRAIFRYMDTRPSAKGVRYRRELIARLIDRVARRGHARVLAIASGHLREAELSRAVRTGQLEEYVAIDQDRASLAVVARDYGRFGVRTMEGSVRQILAGKLNPGQFDFVYAAGLFDYLSGPVAAALTRRMFEMTKPGGLVLIPNFLTSVRDRGYMEAFMDWRLIYRNHDDMKALAATLPPDSVEESVVFDDEDDAITFLLVTKSRPPATAICIRDWRHHAAGNPASRIGNTGWPQRQRRPRVRAASRTRSCEPRHDLPRIRSASRAARRDRQTGPRFSALDDEPGDGEERDGIPSRRVFHNPQRENEREQRPTSYRDV